MKKITSRSTFFSKKVFPTVLFAFPTVVVIKLLFFNDGHSPEIIPLAATILAMVFCYLVMRKLVFDLIDEVYDEGDSLLFKNAGKEFRVSLRDIKNVSYLHMCSPPKVTLSIRYETELGSELTFCAPIHFIPERDSVIEDLINRIDRARDTQVC